MTDITILLRELFSWVLHKCFCHGENARSGIAGGEVKEQAQDGDANAVRRMDGSVWPTCYTYKQISAYALCFYVQSICM
jgi:hypothetical protein